MESFDTDYFMLPYCRSVACVDFGYADKVDYPKAIVFQVVQRVQNGNFKMEPSRILSYISKEKNLESQDSWEVDDQGYDVYIENHGAMDLYTRIKGNIVFTSSLKEKNFLIDRCGIPAVFFANEYHLDNFIAKKFDTWNTVDDFYPKFKNDDDHFNCFSRSSRLAHLIEHFQVLYFSRCDVSTILDSFKKKMK